MLWLKNISNQTEILYATIILSLQESIFEKVFYLDHFQKPFFNNDAKNYVETRNTLKSIEFEWCGVVLSTKKKHFFGKIAGYW